MPETEPPAPSPYQLSLDAIQELPLNQFEGTLQVIERPAQVTAALKVLQGESILGFDTETRPNFTKGQSNPTALLQIASKEQAILFRLLQTGLPRSLKQLLENPEIIKVAQEPVDELLKLHEEYEVKPQGFINLGALSHAHNCKPRSVKGMAALFLGFRISKSAQKSNWENPVLTTKQLSYAATDAWICREIFMEMNHRGLLEGVDAKVPDVLEIIEKKRKRHSRPRRKKKPTATKPKTD